MPQLLAEALCSLAEADLEASAAGRAAAGLLAEAAARAARAAELAEQIGSRLDYGLARRLAGRIAARRGLPADEDFCAAAAVFREIRSSFELACTWARYGEYLIARNPELSATYLTQAEEIFRRIGANAELGRITAQRTVNYTQE